MERPVAESDFENEIWQQCQPIQIKHYWSGEPAPASRHAEARICWSNEALHVRFVGAQQEPLVVSEDPVTDKKTLGLWDRDVCEIFLAPIRQILRGTLSLRPRRPANGLTSELRSRLQEERLIGTSRRASRLPQNSRTSNCWSE